jgi:hypothetical protein
MSSKILKKYLNTIKNAKKYIKSFMINDPIAASTPTPGPTKSKIEHF